MRLNVTTHVILLSLLFLNAACGLQKQDALVEAAGSDGGTNCLLSATNCNGKIEGKPALQYYRQFFYSQEGDCSDKANLRFRYFGNLELFPLRSGNDGKGIQGLVVLNIREDGAYSALYREYEVSKDSKAEPPKVIFERRNLAGNWKLAGTSLIFSDLGVTNAVRLEGKSLTNFRFEKNSLTGVIEGKTFVFGPLYSKFSEDGKTADELCK